MRVIYNLKILAAVFFSVLFFTCTSSNISVSPYVGDWHYTFPTQDGGEMDVTMTINEVKDGYTGFLSSEMGSVDLDDLIIDDGKLSAKFDIQGREITMNGEFDGDTYSGTTNFDGDEFPMYATKKVALVK